MTTKLSGLLIILCFISNLVNSQDNDFFLDLSKAYEKNKIEKTKYFGMFGYIIPSGEFATVDTSFFRNLFNNEAIPTIKPESHFHIANLGFMFNRIYSNFCYGYTLFNDIDNDTLRTSLNQSNYTLTLGYNVFIKDWKLPKQTTSRSKYREQNITCVISPYIGIKAFRLRHRTSAIDKRLSFDQYLENPGYDLRVIQLSVPIGINTTFFLNETFSFGFYFSYLHNFQKHPIIRTPMNNIRNNENLPFGNVSFGMGFGVGISEFRKVIVYKKMKDKK